MGQLSVGSVVARPGKIVTGWFDAVPLPSGDMDRFPVIIVQGRKPGPVFWITTAIHGPEHTGLISLQRLINQELVDEISGTLIAIPTLNPAGLRAGTRLPHYVDTDPNRLFPKSGVGSSSNEKLGEEDARPSDLELAYRRLFDEIMATEPVGLIDLHNAAIGSIPFVFRDPVFYTGKAGKGTTLKQAQALQSRTAKLVDAIGFTVIHDFAAASYIKKDLHRSVSGSLMNKGGVPSVTIELGSWMHVDPGVVDACCAGVRNALRWAGLLPGDFEAISGIPVIKPGYPVRRSNAVYAPHAGIIHQLVRPGELFKKGQPLAQIRDIFGRPIGEDDGLIRSKAEGFVYAWMHGVVRYQGEELMSLAVRDDGNLVVPYPD